MEASSARGGSLLASSSQPPRKEWRAVSDGSYRTSGSEETERSSLGQSDERTVYEEGADMAEYCSIAIDGINGLSNELLQQRLQEVVRQREEIQHLELELRAQAIARPQIEEAQDSFDAQLNEHAATIAKLKEQLQERDKYILDIELKLQDKDRELHTLQIDNEAVRVAWAKDDLLREQNKELATFRRERDDIEAERAQHLQQIHDLQERLHSLEEQHRATHDNLIFKEEQLREAHTWISRVQEIDALQSTTNQTLQAELRERTEQFNQFWLGFQRQYAEMERHHLQAIQQLQLELALYKDGSKAAPEKADSKANIDNLTVNGNSAISNGNVDGSKKPEQGSSLPQVGQSPLLGIGPTYIPPPQITYMLHPSQGIPSRSLSPTNSSLQLGSFQVVPAIPSMPAQFWPAPEAMPEETPVTTQGKFEQSEVSKNLGKQNSIQNQVDLSNQQKQISGLVTIQSGEKSQVIESNKTQTSSLKEAAEFTIVNSTYNSGTSGLQFGSADLTSTLENHESTTAISSQRQEANTTVESGKNARNYTEVASNVNIPKELPLLDERSLLACIVRAIPPGPNNQIKISTTLPNRLAKMLAPLHWHDYMKHYGKLNDFVARHPELFVIEGDFICLREGAHQIISATNAAAQVAAAAAASPASYSSFLPPVALTPVAQTSRQKRSPDQQVNYVNGASLARKKGEQTQQQTALGFNVIQGVADVRISNNGVTGSNARQGFGGKQTARSSTAPVPRR
ncbi:RNA polymerase II degradation factor [Rhynchospora pubera]|uniref:RNA polymerase II degradation factor n=1 Tax=Rhynchospora pubera TaxID=906938 RepID=A0AAV8ER75_9POAL|nr:RNA polymerase II degradation factor [Rhynchospora pubera]